MGRTQRALTSLVAAIPAGFLSYLLVMVFLNSADSLQTTTQAVVGATLLVSAFVTLMPFGLLVLGGKKAAKDDEPAPAADAAVLDDDVEVADDDEVSVTDDDSEDMAATSDFDLADSDADVMADSDDELSTGPASSMDEIEAFDMDDEDDEPKKKKKKK